MSIYIVNESIYALLGYTDYTSGRNYILKDVTHLDVSSRMYDYDFWTEYFRLLREKFNWDFFRGTEIINTSREGIGVNSITVHIGGHLLDGAKLMPVIREVSHNISFQIVSLEYISRILDGIGEKSGYQDIVYINMDLFRFDIFRYVKRDGGTKLNKPSRSNFDFHSSSINWVNRKNLIDNIHNSKLHAFLSFDLSDIKISNIWANYICNPSFALQGSALSDILRSYITVQLLTLLNENGAKYENIGAVSNSTLVVVSGNLVNTLSFQNLLLAITDGLELTNEVDILIDSDMKFVTLGRNCVQGIESQEYIVSLNDLLNGMTKLVTPQIPNSKGRKVIMTGSAESTKEGVKDVYAFSNEITFLDLINGKQFINCKFVQGAKLGNKYDSLELYSDPRNVTYSKLVIDGRGRPVVYGPDSRNNRYKLSEWINEDN